MSNLKVRVIHFTNVYFAATVIMTASPINSGVSVTVLVICIGLVIIVTGGWYFQSSLDELKPVIQQQSSLAELKEETAQMVHQLKEQIIELQLQLQQVKVSPYIMNPR